MHGASDGCPGGTNALTVVCDAPCRLVNIPAAWPDRPFSMMADSVGLRR